MPTGGRQLGRDIGAFHTRAALLDDSIGGQAKCRLVVWRKFNSQGSRVEFWAVSVVI